MCVMVALVWRRVVPIWQRPSLWCSCGVLVDVPAQCAKPTFWSATDFYGLNLSLLQSAARADYFSQPVVG